MRWILKPSNPEDWVNRFAVFPTRVAKTVDGVQWIWLERYQRRIIGRGIHALILERRLNESQAEPLQIDLSAVD